MTMKLLFISSLLLIDMLELRTAMEAFRSMSWYDNILSVLYTYKYTIDIFLFCSTINSLSYLSTSL